MSQDSEIKNQLINSFLKGSLTLGGLVENANVSGCDKILPIRDTMPVIMVTI